MQAVTDLAYILRELSDQRATGRLTVRLPGALASVYFKVGNVIHATLGVTKGSEALSLILQATTQSSEFRAHLSAPEMTIQGPLELFLPRLTSSPPETVDVDLHVKTLQPQTYEDVKTAQIVQSLPPSLQSPSQAFSQPSEVAPEAFMNDLANALVDMMGPIGTVILEDAQADLELESDVPRSEVRALITEITQQLRTPDKQGAFQHEAAVLLARYNLG